MKKLILSSFLLVGVGAGSAQAANLAVITSPPTLLNLVLLGLAVACIVFSLKVLNLIRGGHLGKCWQLFIGGFLLLGVSQLAMLFNVLEIVSLPEFVAPALMAAMAGMFCYGVIEMRRTLG